MLQYKGFTKKKYQVAGRTQLNKEFIEGFDDKPVPDVNYNNYAKSDNTSYNNYQPVNQTKVPETTSVNYVGKPTVNIPTNNLNQGTITKAEPKTVYNTYFNTPSNEHGTGLIRTAANMINASDVVGAGMIAKQGVKYGVKKLLSNYGKKDFTPDLTNIGKNTFSTYNKTENPYYVVNRMDNRRTLGTKSDFEKLVPKHQEAIKKSDDFNRQWIFNTEKYPSIKKAEIKHANIYDDNRYYNTTKKLIDKEKKDYNLYISSNNFKKGKSPGEIASAKFNNSSLVDFRKKNKYSQRLAKLESKRQRSLDNVNKMYMDNLDPTFKSKVEYINQQSNNPTKFKFSKNSSFKKLMDSDGNLIEIVDNPNWSDNIEQNFGIDTKDYLNNRKNKIHGVSIDNDRFTIGSRYVDGKPYIEQSIQVGKTNAHEGGHTIQRIGDWDKSLTNYDDDYKYNISKKDNPISNKASSVMVEPEKAINNQYTHNTYNADIRELHSNLQHGRYAYYQDLLKEGKSHQEAIQMLKNPDASTLDKLYYHGNLGRHFKPTASWQDVSDLIKLLPASAGAVGTIGLSRQNQNNKQIRRMGGNIKKFQFGSQPLNKDMIEKAGSQHNDYANHAIKSRKGSTYIIPNRNPSTHLMSTAQIGDMNNPEYVAFPTLFQNQDGSWYQKNKSKNKFAPLDEAYKRKEVYKFNTEKEAQDFAKGSWKSNNYKNGGKVNKYQVLGKTNLKPTFVDEMGNYKSELKKVDVNYNNYSKTDNTKVNYNQGQVQLKTYPINHKGKTVNVPINKGTITQGKSDTFANNLYNRSKDNKTFNNLANNLIVPITNIAGGLEGANLIKQGVKNIIKRIPKKVPLKVNDISNEIRLYNRNFNNNPTDNYKAIIDKGTNPIISKDIPDEPYERIFHRNYTHGNPDDMHKIIRVNNENINGFANSLSHINNEEDMEPLLKNIIKKYNKENHPNEKGGLNYKPDWLQSIMEKGKQRKPFAKRPNLNTQKSEMSFNFENMINNNHLSKIYKDLERRNIDISNINRIKNNLYKFDDIE